MNACEAAGNVDKSKVTSHRALSVALEVIETIVRGSYPSKTQLRIAKAIIEMACAAPDAIRLSKALEAIKRECILHAEGPHDKTGNMLSIGAWAAQALEGNSLYLLGREGEDESPCPVCGNEERNARTGLLTCECPALPCLKTLSDDLLLDNFHWSKVSDKEYYVFRAELVRRLMKGIN